MAKAERFEDLRCWQTGRRLTNLVYEYSEDGAFANDFSLKDQIRRANLKHGHVPEEEDRPVMATLIQISDRLRETEREHPAAVHPTRWMQEDELLERYLVG